MPPGAVPAGAGAGLTAARIVLVPPRVVTLIAARVLASCSSLVAAAPRCGEVRNVTALRADDERRSEKVPTLTLRGRLDAVNARVEVTLTSSTSASAERWSAAVALTAAPAVGASTSVASSAAAAAATRKRGPHGVTLVT